MQQRQIRLAVALGCAFVIACVIRFAFAHWDSIYDDAFIYLRYVRNLDNGCGLRFNCRGDAVEGFTGPLYVAVLWAGSLVTDRLIWLCQVVGTISLAVACSLAIMVAARLTDATRSPFAPAVLCLAVAAVLGLDDFAMLNAVIGLETAMAAAVFSLLALAAVTDRPRLLIASTCAFVLLRPEALVFVLALPALPVIRRARYLIVVVGFVVFVTAVRYALFDSLLPNTYYAKSGGTLRHAVLGLAYIRDAIIDFPLVILAPLALWHARCRPVAFLLGGSAAWVAFFLRSGGDTFEYSRLVFPLVPVLSALALAGVFELCARRWRLQVARAVVVAFAVAFAGRAWIAHAIPEQHAHPRVVEWSATGTYLRTHVPRGTLVATVPIGAIGYYSQLPILDLVGLTEPAIARAGRSVPVELLTKQWIAHERHNTEYVLARAPTWIVTTMVRDRAWTLADARAGFWADWLLLQEIKTGRAPFHVHDAEVTPGRHVLMFERDR